MSNLKNQLSRDEMKKVVAGIVDPGDGDDGFTACKMGDLCLLYVRELSQWVTGNCARDAWTGPGQCVCRVGQYQTGNGGTTCNQ